MTAAPADDDSGGLLLATVTVQKVLTDDDVVIYYNAVDQDGYELPAIDAVGMLEFAKHELLSPPAEDDEPDGVT